MDRRAGSGRAEGDARLHHVLGGGRGRPHSPLMMSSQPASAPIPESRGAQRRKLGTSAGLHLDRTLPFLVLHRRADDDASASIARRVALNSPAYLVWDAGADDAAALKLLVEMTDELGKPGMPLLI